MIDQSLSDLITLLAQARHDLAYLQRQQAMLSDNIARQVITGQRIANLNYWIMRRIDELVTPDP